MEVERVRMFGVEVADKPGGLQKVLAKLAAGGIDLCCFYAASVGKGKGMVYMGAKDADAFDAFAAESDLKFEETVGFMIEGDDKVGAASAVLKKLADAGINGVAGAAKVCDGRYHLGLIVATDDGDAAEKALK